MNWHYNIIKDKDGYFLGEVFSDKKKKNHSWCDPLVIRTDTLKELLENLYQIVDDAEGYPILEVKKNKLVLK